MTNIEKISKAPQINPHQVKATVDLLDSDNTLPFIARYRKEVTGGLDEEQIRQISDVLIKLRALDERREAILKSVEEQGKLTSELRNQFEGAETLTALEDLYAPYKPKRRTRAMIAKEKGLQGLADWILQQPKMQSSLSQIVKPFLNEQVPTEGDAWAGARDIVAEAISDHPEVRRATREKALQWGQIIVEKIDGAEDEKGVYENYYEFDSSVDRLRPHQILAINRGEAEKVLRVKVVTSERDWRGAIDNFFHPNPASPLASQLQQTILDAADRLLLPAIERDVRRILSEKADDHAIQVFANNLRALLGQPPLTGYTVMGVDPAYRTGCKVAVVDATGKLLTTVAIYPHEPRLQKAESLKVLSALVVKHKVRLIAIGNGTASRETESLIAELIGQLAGSGVPDVQYMIVNEAGASVYSASPLARAELPELDVAMRGAVSIARRVQDPLAELVKIDPKSIGVGMYQYDVDQKQLASSLEGVVESVVNAVGVDVNTASPALLTHVAGIGPKLAEKIVAHRDANGPFGSRNAIKKVGGLGPKAFEQSAGFLRVREGKNPLDASAIHPESYVVAQAVLDRAGINFSVPADHRQLALESLQESMPIDKLAGDLDTGIPTLTDIFEQLVRPGRDPRTDAPAPILRSDVLKMEDLSVGMQLKGTVRNVVDFGAFVDIGVKQDGLLHRTQIPHGVNLQVGDVIDVSIQRVEIERGRIGLGWVRV